MPAVDLANMTILVQMVVGAMLIPLGGMILQWKRGRDDSKSASVDITERAAKMAGEWLDRAAAEVDRARSEAEAARDNAAAAAAAAQEARTAAVKAESRVRHVETIARRLHDWAHDIVANWSEVRKSETPPDLPDHSGLD